MMPSLLISEEAYVPPLILVVFNFSQFLALSLTQLLSNLPLSISYF